MLGDRDQSAWMQSVFYREAYLKVLRFLLIEAGIILLLVIAILYVIFFQHQPNFYGTTTAGKLISLSAIHK